MDLKDRQREVMRLAAQIESKAAEANSEAKSAGGKEREPEFLFFYRCHTALIKTFYSNNNFLLVP